MVETKKYECQYDECHASFKSRSGRTYHERTTHGMLHKDFVRTQPPKEKEKSDSTNFVEIKEIKIMATKKPKDEKKEEDMDTCGGCNEQIPVGSKFCPKCGVQFE